MKKGWERTSWNPEQNVLRLAFALIALGGGLFLAGSGWAALKVVTVPFHGTDPQVPHPAYNGHPTQFKAIARNVPAGCERPFFRWDIDGNGEWDACLGRTPAHVVGSWYQDDRFRLDCLANLPEVDGQQQPERTFLATIEAACSVNEQGTPATPAAGTFRVRVSAQVPRGRSPEAPYNQATRSFGYSARPRLDAAGQPIPAACQGGRCASTGFPCEQDAECKGDTAESLEIKRLVAVQDALWWLHRKLEQRQGDGVATQSATPGQGFCRNGCDELDRLATAAAFLAALVQNGHSPAYPSGAYRHVAPDGSALPPLPVGWVERSAARHERDPLAEDALRLMNYLLLQLTPAPSDEANETNDERPPLTGTDNRAGLYLGNSYVTGLVLSALATSGMAGTTCQVGGCRGLTLEQVVQELVDTACYFQNKGGNDDGSWFYQQRGPFDGSTTQWMLFGLEAVERTMGPAGVIIPKECKNRVANLLLKSGSCDNGSGHYRSQHRCQDLHHTGGLLAGHGWIGTDSLPDTTEQLFLPQSSYNNRELISRYRKGLEFLGNNWSYAGTNQQGHTSGLFQDLAARYDGQARGDVHNLYSVYRGLRTLEPAIEELSAQGGKKIDWYQDMTMFLVNSQRMGGSFLQGWSGSSAVGYYYMSQSLQTALGEALILTNSLFSPGLVAAGTSFADETIEGCAGHGTGFVNFSHESSYTIDISRSIAEYQWIFEIESADQLDFDAIRWEELPFESYSPDGNQFRSRKAEAIPIHVYRATGTYQAALRVLDDSTPPRSAVLLLSGIQVHPQNEFEPDADAGGPYVLSAGQGLSLAGWMADENEICNPDEELTARWYLNDDATPELNQISGAVPWATLNRLNLPRNRPNPIRLVVTDSTNRSTTVRTTLTIHDTEPVACFELLPRERTSCEEAIRVDAGCSSHPDVRQAIRTFEWDWTSNQDHVDQAPEAFPFTTQSAGRTQLHQYPAPGTYRVTLRITDDAGKQALSQRKIVVEPRQGPVADAGGPYLLELRATDGLLDAPDLQLDGSGSRDPDLTCGDRVQSWSWDLDGDGEYDDAEGPRPVVPWVELVALLEAGGRSLTELLADPMTGQPGLPIALRVTDQTGRSHVALTGLTLFFDSPRAEFRAIPERVACGQEVTFDGTRSGHGHPLHGIVRHEWDFDVVAAAGQELAAVAAQFLTEAEGATVQHRYGRFGTYHPVLRVTDDQGQVAYAFGSTVRVDLGNHAPQVAIGGPYAFYIGSLLAFDASATVEPDAACGDTIARFEWDLDGDRTFDDAQDATPHLQWDDLEEKLKNPEQYPADPRTARPAVTIALKVTDEQGASAIATAEVPIYNRLPTPVPHWGSQPVVPVINGRGLVQLDGSASFAGHPGARITDWSWRVKGTAQTANGPTGVMNVTIGPAAPAYPEVTRRTLVLRVTDSAGASAELDFEVAFSKMPSAPPVIRFDVDRYGLFIERGEGFTLSAAGTTDPDGDWIRRISWDLTEDGRADIVQSRADTNGDGQVNELDDPPSFRLRLSWGEMAQFRGLQTMGRHLLKITVTDATGVSASDTVPLTIFDQALVARILATPSNGECTTRFSFDGTASHHLLPGQQLESWEWDLDGDGTPDGAGPIIEHTFGRFGSFPVQLTVRDLFGREAMARLEVTTRDGNRLPLPDPGGPYLVDALTEGSLPLNAVRSRDPDHACGDRIIKYRWDLDGLPGPDGEPTWEVVAPRASLNLPWSQLRNLPRDDPNHPVLLEVEDALGGRARATTTLFISDGAPVAAFRLLPTEVACGQPVSIDASASYHPVPGQRIIHYEWDLAYQADRGFSPSPLQMVQARFLHVFDQMGPVEVALRVTDGRGRSNLARLPVRIANDNQPPVARVAAELRGAWGEPLLLDGSASFDPDRACNDEVVRWEWDLNQDGAFELVMDQPLATVAWEQLAGYGYTAADPFSGLPAHPVRLRVTDRLGATGVLETTLRLFEPTPVAVPTVRPATVSCGTDQVFDGRSSYPSHPDRPLTTYLWDFDIEVDQDGDGDPTNDRDGAGPIVTHRYDRMAFERIGEELRIKPHRAALRVMDSWGHTASAPVEATLRFQNFRPTARPGGPYRTTILGSTPVPVHLDGSLSFDPNQPCDGLAVYQWDTDGDGRFGREDADGSPLCGPQDCEGAQLAGVFDPGWQLGRTYPVTLRVIDSYGAMSEPALTTIEVRDQLPPNLTLLSPVGGQQYRGVAEVRLRMSHPLGRRVRLAFLLNENPLAFFGNDRVALPADGSALEVVRTFDTTALPDGVNVYRLTVEAWLEEAPNNRVRTQLMAPFGVDNRPPVLSIPAAEQAPVIEQLELAGTPFAFHPTVTDELDPTVRVIASPALKVYPLGRTRVAFSARDRAGNVGRASSTLTVRDTQPPQLMVGPAISQEAVSPVGTQVLLRPAAWDSCDAHPTITTDAPADGFRVGNHTVTLTATDGSGNQATGTVKVTITDRTPPLVTLPEPPVATLNQSDRHGVAAGQVVIPMPLLRDNGTVASALRCRYFVTLRDPQGLEVQPPAEGFVCGAPVLGNRFFPPGETVIRYQVRDAAGNETGAAFRFQVVDSSSPAVNLVEAPASMTWLKEAAQVAFSIFDASDLRPIVTVDPLPAGMLALPPPDGAGVYRLRYDRDGRYELRIGLKDQLGNQALVLLDDFGIDRTPPTISVERLAIPDPWRPADLPIYFHGEQPAPEFIATDPLSGVSRMEARVTPGKGQVQGPGASEEPLLELTFQPIGAPRTGPAFVDDIGCTDREGLCRDHRLLLEGYRKGEQKLIYAVKDMAENTATHEIKFRIIDLAEALSLVRGRLAEYRQRDDLSAAAEQLLPEIDGWLARGAQSLGRGYLGGCLLSLEAALKLMLHGGVVREVPELAGDAELLARGAQSESFLAWKARAAAEPDRGLAAELLQRATQVRATGQSDVALLTLENAWFFSRNAEVPYEARDISSSLAVVDGILAELTAYLAHEELPGRTVLTEVRQAILDKIRWKYSDLEALGSIDSHHYIKLLLDLQDLVRHLETARQEGAWVRNWQWGLGQLLWVVVDLSRADAQDRELGPDHCLVREADRQYQLGAEWPAAREVDRLLARYAGRELRCLMLELYQAAGFQPTFPLFEYGCVVQGCGPR